MTIQAHGGELINRELKGTEREEALQKAKLLPTLTLSDWAISDLELIGIGGFSPLIGFIGKKDYESVLHNARLEDGTIWSIPITLSASEQESEKFEIGDEIALKGEDDVIYGTLELDEKYSYDKQLEAEKIYGTTDENHAGVEKLYARGDVYLAGSITLLNRPTHPGFEAFYKDPIETRQLFKELGWKTIVGFQTRNPVHRAHEYIQKSRGCRWAFVKSISW